MAFPFFSRALIILAVLTLLAVGAYRFLPDKEWVWLPDTNAIAHIYADDAFGGASTSKWVDERDVHFSCEIRESSMDAPPFCGFHVHFDRDPTKYADLSVYNRIKLNVEYTGGNEKLRFYLNEFVPGFSNPDDPVGTRTAKYMGAFVSAAETRMPFLIEMDEFIVAEWWANEYNVPREYSRASWQHVLTFGVDISYPTALGHHEFKLKSVTFIGDWISAEQWYLSIVLIWVAILLIASAFRIYLLVRYTSKLQKEKIKYEKMSMVDQLTGLMNRHGLLNYFKTVMINREQVCMLLVDIDHFKLINDSFGHRTGDVILMRIASAIEDQLSKGDKASRWGGEEFLILMPNVLHEDARLLAERVRTSVMNLHHPELASKTVTISIGVCDVEQNSTFDESFSKADAALYRAKKCGRNRVVSEIEARPNGECFLDFNAHDLS